MASMSGPLLVLVPARAGSRRVPGKNLRTVAGIPLVGWAIRTGQRAVADLPGGPHLVALSTDGPEIAAAGRAWGADRVIDRPPALATDTATSVDVVVDALGQLDREGRRFAAVVLLQPTSPLTEPGDVRAAIAAWEAGGTGSVVSVAASHPAGWHVELDPDGGLVREEAEATHLLTGAIYVIDPELLRAEGRFVIPGRTRGVVVPAERSVDLDEPHDLMAAEGILAARPVRPVPLGALEIGAGRPVVIAEVGVNHNGDVELAHRLVDAVADSGADVVKFQTFDPAQLAATGAPTAEYQRAATTAGDDQRAMLARLVMPVDAWPALAAHAAQRGLVFLSTPFDDDAADLLDRLGVPAFKVGSGELTNLPFLARLARCARPMLVSTGMADMAEVAAAVDAIAAAGDQPLALLHCVSSYPAAPRDANLRAIETMRRAFGVPVGWSDHTPGIELPLAAVAAGAAVVEKHITLDRTLPGPDHRASLEPAEFAELVRGVRTVGEALGTGVKEPVPAERPIAAVARRSLHWRRALAAGSLVTDEDLVALRPGTALSPARQRLLVGSATVRAVTAGEPVAEDDVEPQP